MNVLSAFGITCIVVIAISYFGIFIPEMLSSDSGNMVLLGVAGLIFPILFIGLAVYRVIREKWYE